MRCCSYSCNDFICFADLGESTIALISIGLDINWQNYRQWCIYIYIYTDLSVSDKVAGITDVMANDGREATLRISAGNIGEIVFHVAARNIASVQPRGRARTICVQEKKYLTSALKELYRYRHVARRLRLFIIYTGEEIYIPIYMYVYIREHLRALSLPLCRNLINRISVNSIIWNRALTRDEMREKKIKILNATSRRGDTQYKVFLMKLICAQMKEIFQISKQVYMNRI